MGNGKSRERKAKSVNKQAATTTAPRSAPSTRNMPIRVGVNGFGKHVA